MSILSAMKHAALMIDIQRPWDSKNPETTRRIEAALPAIRKNMEVIWIYFNPEWLCRSPGASLRGNLPGIFNLASEGHTAIPRNKERIIFKHDEDSFADTALGPYLKKQKIDHLYVCGFQLSACVLRTVETATLSDIFVTVLHPLCADSDDKVGRNTPERYQALGVPLRDTSILEKMVP